MSVFGVFLVRIFRIQTEYWEIRNISLHSVQMRKNVYQKNSKYGHFSRSGIVLTFSDRSAREGRTVLSKSQWQPSTNITTTIAGRRRTTGYMPVNHKMFRPFRINIRLNPFVLNAPFLYPLKTSENRNVFWYFQGVEERCIGTNGLIWAFFSKKKLCKKEYWKKRNIGTKWIKFLFIK